MYYLQEQKNIGEYTSKKEALADADNHNLWYPENNYYVVNEEGKKVEDIATKRLMEKVEKNKMEYFHSRAEKANDLNIERSSNAKLDK